MAEHYGTLAEAAGVLALQRKVCSQFELPFKKDIPPGMQAYLRWFIQKEQD